MSRKRNADGLDNTDTNPQKKRKVNSASESTCVSTQITNTNFKDNKIEQNNCLELFRDTLSFSARILLYYAGCQTMHNLIKTNILTKNEWNILLPFHFRLKAYISSHIDDVADNSYDINYELVIKKIKIWNDYKIDDNKTNKYPYNIKFDINNNLIIKTIVWFLILYGWNQDKIFNFTQIIKYITELTTENITSDSKLNHFTMLNRYWNTDDGSLSTMIEINDPLQIINRTGFDESIANENKNDFESFNFGNIINAMEDNGVSTIEDGSTGPIVNGYNLDKNILNELNNKILLTGFLNTPNNLNKSWYCIDHREYEYNSNTHIAQCSNIVYGLFDTQLNQFEEEYDNNSSSQSSQSSQSSMYWNWNLSDNEQDGDYDEWKDEQPPPDLDEYILDYCSPNKEKGYTELTFICCEFQYHFSKRSNKIVENTTITNN